MQSIDLSLACVPTDRSHPILEGRVGIPGVNLQLLPNEPEQIFGRALREEAFDITEMSMCSHIVQVAQKTNKYIAVPVFPARSFRHSAIFIRTDRGIKSAADLAGRTIGIPDYQQTAALWIRGFLRDIYGVDTKTIKWRTGGMEKPGPGSRTKLDLPADVDVAEIGPEKSLNGMLASGEIDAIMAPRTPSCAADPATPVDRLFKDYRQAEVEYYKKTGFFPIMHCIVIKKSLAESHPELPGQVFKMFQDSFAVALDDIDLMNVPRNLLPWGPLVWEEAKAALGDDDLWPYGFEKNAHHLATMIRYCFEDGLTKRQPDPAELFHPSVI